MRLGGKGRFGVVSDNVIEWCGEVKGATFDVADTEPIEVPDISESATFDVSMDEAALDLLLGKYVVLFSECNAFRVRRSDYYRAKRERGEAPVVPPIVLMDGCTVEQAARWLMEEHEGSCSVAVMGADGEAKRKRLVMEVRDEVPD